MKHACEDDARAQFSEAIPRGINVSGNEEQVPQRVREEAVKKPQEEQPGERSHRVDHRGSKCRVVKVAPRKTNDEHSTSNSEGKVQSWPLKGMENRVYVSG
jgi:hypothetical protein